MSVENPLQSAFDDWSKNKLPLVDALNNDLYLLTTGFREGTINSADLIQGLVANRRSVGTIAYVDQEAIATIHGPEFYVPHAISIDITEEGKLQIEGSGDDGVRAIIGLSPEGQLQAEVVEFLPTFDDFEYEGADEETTEIDPTPTENLDPAVLDALNNYLSVLSDPSQIEQNKKNWGKALVVALTHVKTLPGDTAYQRQS